MLKFAGRNPTHLVKRDISFDVLGLLERRGIVPSNVFDRVIAYGRVIIRGGSRQPPR